MNQLLARIVEAVVADDRQHARWLNSLSLLENCGARKITASEHPVRVDLTVLKHASEECRHAYYLKKMIGRLEGAHCPTYEDPYLLAPAATRRLLDRLDDAVCRALKKNGADPERLRQGAYILVTYVIEVRADRLYATYQQVLTAQRSKVNVKSIIAEEEGHLEEMTGMLKDFDPAWEELVAPLLATEERLFTDWLRAIEVELSSVMA